MTLNRHFREFIGLLEKHGVGVLVAGPMSPPLAISLFLISLSGLTGWATERQHPLEQLPDHMRVLVGWGQRPEFSANGRFVYFVAKAWNEVFRVELSSGRIEPVTLHFWHEGFQRVLCLPSGDLLLLGGEAFDAADPDARRHRLAMWILQQPFNRPPVKLDAYCDEGPAVERAGDRIAWTDPGQRRIRIARVVDLDSVPRLVDVQTVLDQDERNLPVTHRLETQDFWPGTDRLIFTHYRGTEDEPFYFANAEAIDLKTGEVTPISALPDTYTEAEGVAPDGSFLLVESDRENERQRWRLDVYLHPLDGSSPPRRLCRWNRFKGYRSDNPVVSPDGRLIAIQCGFMAGAGEGRGIVLMDLAAWTAAGRPVD